jgi:hypothetical protein
MVPPRNARDDDEHRILGSKYTPDDVALFKDIAEAAAENVVHRLLVTMGLNPKEPLDSQRDFQVLRNLATRGTTEDAAADAAWVRRWRPRTEGIVGKLIIAVATLAVASGAHALWLGIKALVVK